MWKFQDISALIFYVEGPKTAILTIWPALNFEFLGIFDIFKCKIPKKSKFKASKIVKMADFDLQKSAKNYFA